MKNYIAFKVITHIIKIFRKVKLMKSKNKSIKVIGCIVIGIVLVFSIIFVIVYQKCKWQGFGT